MGSFFSSLCIIYSIINRSGTYPSSNCTNMVIRRGSTPTSVSKHSAGCLAHTAYLLPTSQYPLLPHISLIDLGNDNEFERAENQNLAKAGIVNLISSHKLHKALGKR